MSAKHTPGPWRWLQQRTMQVLLAGAYPLAVKMPMPGNKLYIRENDGVREANARLIAAAPDLLEALRGVLRVADRKTVEFAVARIAIAKAIGET